MSEELFNFELVTPEKVIVSGSVSSVSIAGVEGDMTIFANHSPIATAIRPPTTIDPRGITTDPTIL